MPGAASAADNVVTATADLPDGTPGTGVPGYSAQADAPVALKNAGLEISKTPDQQIVNWGAGENAEWDLTVTNPQDADITGVTVTDTFPLDWTFVSSTPAPLSLTTDTQGRVFATWEVGPLASGDDSVIHVVAAPPAQPAPIVSVGDAGRYDRNYTTADADQISGTVEDDAYVRLYTPIEVGDLLWEDLNGDGLQSDGEPGVGGVSVTLMGEDMFGHPVVVTVTTEADGTYLFTQDADGVPLAPGTYTVTFGLPSGYQFTTQGSGADVAVEDDSDVNAGA